MSFGQSVISYHLCLLLFLLITTLWIPNPSEATLSQVTPSPQQQTTDNQLMTHPSSHTLTTFGLRWFLVQSGWYVSSLKSWNIEDFPHVTEDSFLCCLWSRFWTPETSSFWYGGLIWMRCPHRFDSSTAWSPVSDTVWIYVGGGYGLTGENMSLVAGLRF